MHFVLKISKQCNLRCTYCYEYEELGDRERMPIERLERFFAGLADWYRQEEIRYPLRFVLHGGEPLLLPDEYLQEFAAAQRRHLGAGEVPFSTTLQTNLTRIDAGRLRLLEELGIGLGISFDVFGEDRVYLSGRDSRERVLDNLQLLFDTGAIRRLGVGGISVLHAGNVEDAVRTFHFWRLLGLDYRILPVFSLADPPPRMRHLMLEPPQILGALRSVVDAMLETETSIRVYPLYHYLTAAVLKMSGHDGAIYDPSVAEWALIVNTNGDAYTHSGSYAEEGLLGNIFEQSMGEVMEGERRRQAIALRGRRAETCERCAYSRSCSRLPLVEALPSERATGADGAPACPIAKPMIDYIVGQVIAGAEARAATRDGIAARIDDR
ncbi:MAG TPA: radical SAM protein [Solirubrobacterales bacterium]|nr:radical SAM protein [Solirubrobacterales bacterium]